MTERLIEPLAKFHAQIYKNGSFVEVLLLSFVRVEEVIGEEGFKIMKSLRANDYKVITEEDEKRLLSMLSKGIYNILYINE